MNCIEIAKATQWICTPNGNNSVRVTAPFTFANDGQHISFHVAFNKDGDFIITDTGDTAMLLSSIGADVTSRKLTGVANRFDSDFVKINKSGEIRAAGKKEDLKIALWDAAMLAYRVSIESQSWMPKLNQIQFKQFVETLIKKSVGEQRLVYNPKTIGVSGHTIEFPFAVRAASNDFLFYIEPLPVNEYGDLDWNNVHRLYGKLSDEKGSESNNKRVVVIDDGISQKELGNAANILAQVASILQPKKVTNWQEKFAA